MTTPAGWYDDPNEPNAQRYWDGQDWTPHRQRKPASQPAPQPVMSPPPAPQPVAPLPPPPPTAPLPPPPPGQQPQWAPPAQAPNTGARQRSRTPIVALAVVAVVVLAVAGVLVYKFVLTGKSDEDQIRAVVQAFTNDWNSSDTTALASLGCHQAGTPYVDKLDFAQSRAEVGPISSSVTGIHITGDHATADVTMTQSQPPQESDTGTFTLSKENGTWKVCDISQRPR